MKKVNYFILFLFVLSLEFTSCNKNETSPIYIPLSVIETFNPAIKEFIITESQDIIQYKEDTIIVNSISELPDDIVFGNEEFIRQDLDFSKYTLIIFYDLEFGKILSIKYRWGYDTVLDLYQVSISYEIEKGSDIADGKIELASYVRGAMLVDKIPSQSIVSQSVGIHWVDSE